MGKVIDTLQPGQEKPYPAGGNYLTVVKSLELLEIDLINRSDSVESHVIKSGTLHDKKFDSIVVKNLGASAVNITIVTGVGKITQSQDEAVVTVDTSGGSVPVTLDEAQLNVTISQNFVSDVVNNPGDVLAGAAATLAIAANANRKEVEICLPSDATNPVRIGNASVTASSGSILEPGTSKVFGCEAALYVIRTASPDETVTVLELERP